ncbi:AraC family transcriptional regulator [Herbiconiux moechotypicola]|uniref:HTH araC/xylS-type domain-containing protein n=1 Tax=Herbiconiux moechotypicola TaxID=637393 RepID=A0ABP5R314_9MICO|nr:AraC family transcriptional regulator [Herbiconiux moechotypicola]MCS5731544.1 AraC family transcriptional regulator [Herbiconiux moechotypicola]
MARLDLHDADAGGPPPIPATRSDSAGHPRRPLLVWVRTGSAQVNIDGEAAFRLSAGQGAWIAANGWRHRAIVTDPGTVAFTIGLHPASASVAGTVCFDVPEHWQDWLIHHFTLNVTPLQGLGYSPHALLDILHRGGSHPESPSAADAAPDVSMPEMPSGTAARVVAEELVRDPALTLTVAQWASRTHSSERTLRRDFVAGTGLTFERWRLRTRLIASVELLGAGYDVDQVASRVGFTTRNGFTRAFKQEFGPTPYDFGRKVAAAPSGAFATPRAALARQADDLVRIVRAGSGFGAAPELLPAARTPSHANETHVLSWMYRGSGYLDVGDRRYERRQGVATWIPAGVKHVTGLRENAISLPLGDADTSDLRLTEPLQVRFSPAWDDYLMFCAMSARSYLQPDDHDPRHILDLFAEQVAAQRARSVVLPTEPRARAMALEYLRRIGEGEGEEPSSAVAPSSVLRAFREETGMSFARWRYSARMRIAGDLLVGGARPTAVARSVGYTHLPTFSAAFTRFHGVPAREYRERSGRG